MDKQQAELKNIKPYHDRSVAKKKQLEEMFDRIAPVYDKANHLFTLNIDKYWRKKAIAHLKAGNPSSLLDVATGTGDFAFEAARQLRGIHITGIDLSEGMMEIGRQKAARKHLDEAVTFEWGDVENMGYASNSFDATSVAFGVRNFADLPKGLEEMHRVLKPGGKAVILELGMPTNRVLSFFYNFYFEKLMPAVGGWLSKDQAAYRYLNQSVEAFPGRDEFLELMENAGFKNTKCSDLTFGICTLYVGVK